MSDLLVEEDPLIKEKIDLLSLQYPDFASYELRRALTKNDDNLEAAAKELEKAENVAHNSARGYLVLDAERSQSISNPAGKVGPFNPSDDVDDYEDKEEINQKIAQLMEKEDAELARKLASEEEAKHNLEVKHNTHPMVGHTSSSGGKEGNIIGGEKSSIPKPKSNSKSESNTSTISKLAKKLEREPAPPESSPLPIIWPKPSDSNKSGNPRSHSEVAGGSGRAPNTKNTNIVKVKVEGEKIKQEERNIEEEKGKQGVVPNNARASNTQGKKKSGGGLCCCRGKKSQNNQSKKQNPPPLVPDPVQDSQHLHQKNIIQSERLPSNPKQEEEEGGEGMSVPSVSLAPTPSRPQVLLEERKEEPILVPKEDTSNINNNPSLSSCSLGSGGEESKKPLLNSPSCVREDERSAPQSSSKIELISKESPAHKHKQNSLMNVPKADTQEVAMPRDMENGDPLTVNDDGIVNQIVDKQEEGDIEDEINQYNSEEDNISQFNNKNKKSFVYTDRF